MEPGQVLDELAALKRAIEETARREEQVRGAHTTCIVAARRIAREREEREHEEEEARRSLLEQRHAAEREVLEARHQARLAWIEERFHSARQSLTERISQSQGSRVGRMQAEILRVQEQRKHEYEQAKHELVALREQAEEQRGEVAILAAGARKSLRAFRPFFDRKLSGKGVKVSDPGDGDLMAAASAEVEKVKALPLAKFFRFVPLTLLLLVAVGAVAWFSGTPGEVMAWLPMAGIAAGVVLALYLIALASVWGPTMRLVHALHQVRVAGAMSVNSMRDRVLGLKEEIDREAEQLRGGLSETLRETDDSAQERIREGTEKLERQVARLPEVEERIHQRRVAALEAVHAGENLAFADELRQASEKRAEELGAETGESDAETEKVIAALASEWPERVTRPVEALTALAEDRERRFPAWSDDVPDSWVPPEDAESVAPFGKLRIPMDALVDKRPEDERFPLPDEIEVPLAIGLPDHGSLLLEGEPADAASTINEIVLRLLATHPPGRVDFTFIDAVGLGRDFAGLMHLADYEDHLIHGRIWTQPQQIEERLAELNEHVEKVIQMYLRNEYATIADYNRQAGTIAEKYRFVVIAGLPTGFSETALGRLRSLAASGARCGVFLLVQLDGPLPDAALDAELRRSCLCLKQSDGRWQLDGQPGEVTLDHAPADALATRLVHRFGKASVDSNRVEVPFSSIAPQDGWWTEETGDELRVPIGRTGAKKLQYLAIGKGTKQHALIAGKTGSGKSTLFHVMITNLALHCSPDEVEFYLIDFKKGVEFKCYGSKRLPHARVVAIESDRDFGLSVLHRVDEELRHRGELFREHGAQDLAGYRKASGEIMPRTLLMIDEFQEFFTEDDGIAQEASLLLDRIIRQGRAFGIHCILGSQTLGGAYTLARATLGQMVIRIALQCNEADAYLIMDDDNPAPRLLTRPGEGIYNDNAGAVAANSPFQTVWLSEDERNERLDEMTALAKERGVKVAPPVVFEGNAPAELADNDLLAAALASPPEAKPELASAWLGAPNSIKGPTTAGFKRQSGSNLLLVGQGEERIKALMGASILSLSAQYPLGTARFVVLDPEGKKGYLAGLLNSLPHPGEVHVPGSVGEVVEELSQRLKSDGDDEVFVFVRDLQRFKALKQDDEFRFDFDADVTGKVDAAKAFLELASEGPGVGIHLIASVDTWANVGRWLPRKALSDFPLRVLFQMSANDSAALTDSPAAGKLGLHRALLYDESLGSLETFRPYAKAAAPSIGAGR
ncbi:ATP-binding protein [Haloferula helveola]|uniref:ATP-binding protein n=1 Tax=Haloferula helveola TaxID=490095 RepID=A0ABM7RFQ7_9BACT|nr:ATP-binding protein [Haloferula helveola]